MDLLAEKYYSISPFEDKTQDTFYMVAKDPDGDYQRTFTTDAEGNKNYNSISFEYGLINTQNDGSIVMTNHNEISVSANGKSGIGTVSWELVSDLQQQENIPFIL